MLLKRTEMEKFTWIFDNNENIISTKAPHLYHNPKIIGTCLINREPGLTDDDYLNMSKTDAKTYNAYIHGQVYKLITEDLHSNEIEEFIVYGKDRSLEMYEFFKEEIMSQLIISLKIIDCQPQFSIKIYPLMLGVFLRYNHK